MTKKKEVRAGRPTTFTKELAHRVLHRISTSTEGLEKLCETHEDLPNKSTVYEWLLNNQEFSDAFKRARVIQTQLCIQELESVTDAEFYYDEKGVKRYDAALVAQRRLKVETRKWLASKIIPSVYGDKMTVETDTKEKEELKKEIAALREKLDQRNHAEY